MLTNKFKSERGKLKSPEVLVTRSKYSAKRRLVSTANEVLETVAKRCSRVCTYNSNEHLLTFCEAYAYFELI
jgi:hypothetical protein